MTTTSRGSINYGDRAAHDVSTRVAGTFASTTDLATLGPRYRSDGALAVLQTGQLFRFSATSTASASAAVIVPSDAPAAGRWLLQLPASQYGSATLVAGTVTVSSVTLTSTSVITVSRKTQAGTITSTIGYEAPSASRNTSAGSFVINAVTSAGAVATTDTSVIDWVIVG